MNNPNPFQTGTSGCTCSQCGGWIPDGFPHACNGPVQPSWPTQPFLSQATGLAAPWVTLLPLLERLTVALEKIADKAGENQT